MRDLAECYRRWDELYENGGSDPNYADGYGLNHLRKMIDYRKNELAAEHPSGDLPDCYYRELPSEVPNDFMVKADEIRANAKAVLPLLLADENYIFLCSHAAELPKKVADRMCVRNVIRFVTRLGLVIAADNVLTMRLYMQPKSYHEALKSCAAKVQDFLSSENIQTAMPGMAL